MSDRVCRNIKEFLCRSNILIYIISIKNCRKNQNHYDFCEVHTCMCAFAEFEDLFYFDKLFEYFIYVCTIHPSRAIRV